jgi:predicted aminopeptidase
VPAYSTLGWLDDPVTEPMLQRGEGSTVETIFHELVHATVYVKGHADFNETVATFIGQEASVRFYENGETPDNAQARRTAVDEQRALGNVLVNLRQQVAALYADEAAADSRDVAREDLVRQARAEIATLTFGTQDAAAFAREIRLNDACLALSGTYGAEMGRYVAKLAALDGDLPALVGRLRSVADAPDPAEEFLGP